MSVVIDQCPYPARQALDRLGPVDRIRTWQTWQRKYPDAPAADRATVVRIIDHAMKSYDVSEDDRRILRAEAQRPTPRSTTAPVPAVPAPTAPARPAPGSRPIHRSADDGNAADRFFPSAPARPPVTQAKAKTPRPEPTREVPIHITANSNMLRRVAALSDGRGGVVAEHNCIATPAPQPGKPRTDELSEYQLFEMLGKPGNFTSFITTIFKPDRTDDNGCRFWLKARAAKFAKPT